MTDGGLVVLESEALRVTVNPQVGGTITAVEHKGLGASVLGTTPWEPEIAPLESFAAPDERTWLTRYGGGWPLLFPNGGDACEFDGVFHGFHGEASLAPWEAAGDGAVLRLTRRFAAVPVEMHRETGGRRRDRSPSGKRLRMLGDAADQGDVGTSSDLRLRPSRRPLRDPVRRPPCHRSTIAMTRPAIR